MSDMLHQCYYCEQIFNSKEELYNHVTEHDGNENKDSNTNIVNKQ